MICIDMGMANTYDERQTKACNAVRERLMSIISRANDALQVIGSDPCADAIDDVLRDARFAMDTNNAILMDKI
jgi:hypothetical protein